MGRESQHSGGVELFCRALHADPPVYNNCFSYPKLMQKNHPLHYTKSYIHHLPTYLSFRLNKMHFLSKMVPQRMALKASGGRTVFKQSKKFSLWESYDAISQRTGSTDSSRLGHSLHSGHFCDPPVTHLPYHAYSTPQRPMGTPTKLEKNYLEDGSFKYSKYRSNPITRFNSHKLITYIYVIWPFQTPQLSFIIYIKRYGSTS